MSQQNDIIMNIDKFELSSEQYEFIKAWTERLVYLSFTQLVDIKRNFIIDLIAEVYRDVLERFLIKYKYEYELNSLNLVKIKEVISLLIQNEYIFLIQEAIKNVNNASFFWNF